MRNDIMRVIMQLERGIGSNCQFSLDLTPYINITGD